MKDAIHRVQEWVKDEVRDAQLLNAFGQMPGVSISLEQDVPNSISLHYRPDKKDSTAVRWKQFNDALVRLDALLKKDYSHITHIYATTWIAYDSVGREGSRFFKNYGFTVTQPEKGLENQGYFSSEPYKTLARIYVENRKKFGIHSEHADIPPGVAEYSREDFIAENAKWRKWANRAR